MFYNFHGAMLHLGQISQQRQDAKKTIVCRNKRVSNGYCTKVFAVKSVKTDVSTDGYKLLVLIQKNVVDCL